MEVVLGILGMLALGASIGVTSAALGVGGGFLLVPAFLEFVPGMDFHTAKGTSLFVIVFVALFNTWRLHDRLADIQLRVAAFLAAGAVTSAYLAAWLAESVSGHTLTLVFAGLLFALGLRTFWMKKPDPAASAQRTSHHESLLALLIGVTVGTVSGVTGLGGGAILVPLVLVAGLSTNKQVVGLSNTVMVATCLSASIAHFRAPVTYTGPLSCYGQVVLWLVPLTVLGAQAGVPLGRYVNKRLTFMQRRYAMCFLLLFICLRLVLKAMRAT